LLASEPLDLILSDDGMQHYRLARDLELVLIDAARGLGNKRCLPAGPLREPIERLQSVDAVLFNGATADREEGFAFTCSRPRWSICAAASAAAGAFSARPIGARGGRDRQSATFLQYPRSARLAGNPPCVCRPRRIQRAGLEFHPSLPLVMTEKDAVKCRAFAADDWWYLAVDAVPSPAFVAWFDTQLMRLLPDRLLP
jgi:tetraacyldisaccharide 4'-kinase